MPTEQAHVDNYSGSYFLVHCDVLPYGGERVVVPRDLYAKLSELVRRPVLRVDSGHYAAFHEWGIPGGTVAVPDEVYNDGLDHVLLAKDDHALELIHDNDVLAEAAGGDLPNNGE